LSTSACFENISPKMTKITAEGRILIKNLEIKKTVDARYANDK